MYARGEQCLTLTPTLEARAAAEQQRVDEERLAREEAEKVWSNRDHDRERDRDDDRVTPTPIPSRRFASTPHHHLSSLGSRGSNGSADCGRSRYAFAQMHILTHKQTVPITHTHVHTLAL